MIYKVLYTDGARWKYLIYDMIMICLQYLHDAVLYLEHCFEMFLFLARCVFLIESKSSLIHFLLCVKICASIIILSGFFQSALVFSNLEYLVISLYKHIQHCDALLVLKI